MQTFLPYPSMHDSLLCLDKLRLNKQITEAAQIRDTLEFGSSWENHPAVIMWEGYETALEKYYNTGLEIWETRKGGGSRKPYQRTAHQSLPWWWGFDLFHESHQANLKRKNHGFYAPKFEVNLNNVPETFYLWPVTRISRDGVPHARFLITTPRWATKNEAFFNYMKFHSRGFSIVPCEGTRYLGEYPVRYYVDFPMNRNGQIINFKF